MAARVPSAAVMTTPALKRSRILKNMSAVSGAMMLGVFLLTEVVDVVVCCLVQYRVASTAILLRLVTGTADPRTQRDLVLFSAPNLRCPLSIFISLLPPGRGGASLVS